MKPEQQEQISFLLLPGVVLYKNKMGKGRKMDYAAADYREQGGKRNQEKLDQRLKRAELVTRQEIIRESKKLKKVHKCPDKRWWKITWEMVSWPLVVMNESQNFQFSMLG